VEDDKSHTSTSTSTSTSASRNTSIWDDRVTAAAQHQYEAEIWRINQDMALEVACERAATDVQRVFRSWQARHRLEERERKYCSATSIQKVWRGRAPRRNTVRPSSQRVVHGLHHAITEYRRQIARAMWLRKILDKDSILYVDLTNFIGTLRLRYKVGVGNWMRGSNKGVVANPQRLVAMILKYLVHSSKELARHEEAHAAVVAYRAGAVARKKLVQKRHAMARMHAVQAQFRRERDAKRRLLEAEMARIAADKARAAKSAEMNRLRLEMVELEAKGEALALARAADIARELLATREKFAALHKGMDLRDAWQFRGRGLEGVPPEDLDVLQEIEDDLASLAENHEEFDAFVWDSALDHEDQRRQSDDTEAARLREREFVVRFERPPIGIKVSGRECQLVVKGFQFGEDVVADRFDDAFLEDVRRACALMSEEQDRERGGGRGRGTRERGRQKTAAVSQKAAAKERSLSPERRVALGLVEGVLGNALAVTAQKPVWPKNMKRILPGDELVGVGGKLFVKGMRHEQRMQTIASAPFPLELIFRKVYS
jgi:hypothetical protein